jgi:hypothetical protein
MDVNGGSKRRLWRIEEPAGSGHQLLSLGGLVPSGVNIRVMRDLFRVWYPLDLRGQRRIKVEKRA